ncbi:MAG: putative DNA binding domain-containing protein [Microcystis sp. M086S1]|uniref:RNA-binding domain-containing protein n=1 Tax=Microcystis sp. M086S1 TaxID=2771133 RepID=UPI00259010CD|nr:RNA-binding domain-containing protein [Microcystis sp. M086S1]MCA2828558.1 putative DNA binding domain-containing protein [Microcystis sp. M086S1]
MEIDTLLQQIDIGEDQEYEFKSAEGGLPKDIWETLSAFANTDGGYIILGVSEKHGKLNITGINNPQNYQKIFWDTHNNSQKLNIALCSNSDVQVRLINHRNLLLIHVPRASRIQRPVYINNNPITGTYKRNHEGDYLCSKEEIQQMFRDASNEPQDFQLLDNFNLNDVDTDTLKIFRQRFSNREPDHPWLAYNDQQLLHQLGGWRRDRNSSQEGLTVAGLLMFGRERSILDAFPHYSLDYQEKLSDDPEKRWTYRLTLDGKWEANLLNSYYRIYGRLINNLDVTFQLDKDAVRKDETHVHEALREALVNTLIHADHQSSRPIKVVKSIDGYLFSNPGRLRIPLQRLYEGGTSDPRNPNLQKMFQMLGLGEKAGSGFGKILRAWKEQQWEIPRVSEELDLEVTSVNLRMTSLIPASVEVELKGIIGDAYRQLGDLDRIILVLAHQFDEISNIDIQRYRSEHPRDISEHLRNLVKNGWLDQSGKCRGTRYTLSNQNSLAQLSPLPSSEHYEPSSEHYEPSSEHYEQLEAIAEPIRRKGRTSKDSVRKVILELCSQQYLPLRTLAQLLGREPDTIRNHYVNPMIDEGLLKLKHPEQRNHPQQAYRTVSRSHFLSAQDE